MFSESFCATNYIHVLSVRGLPLVISGIIKVVQFFLCLVTLKISSYQTVIIYTRLSNQPYYLD